MDYLGRERLSSETSLSTKNEWKCRAVSTSRAYITRWMETSNDDPWQQFKILTTVWFWAISKIMSDSSTARRDHLICRACEQTAHSLASFHFLSQSRALVDLQVSKSPALTRILQCLKIFRERWQELRFTDLFCVYVRPMCRKWSRVVQIETHKSCRATNSKFWKFKDFIVQIGGERLNFSNVWRWVMF